MIGLTMAVVFAFLPMAASPHAAAQDDDGRIEIEEAVGDDVWLDLSDRIPAPPDPATGPERADQHVINGTPIAITERPWHVLVADESFGGSWCGGSIIEANLIVTAAHCVDNLFLDESRLLVVAGSAEWRDVENGQWRFARNVTMHPSYVPNSGLDGPQGLDVALIELARPLTFNESVQPIELASPAEAAAALGAGADLAGWGVNTLPAQDGIPSTTLLNGRGVIVSDTFCGALLGRVLDGPQEMCLDGIATSQTGCFGDSGGGTTVFIGGSRKLLGVASATFLQCGLSILLVAETAAAIDWIRANTPPIVEGGGTISGRIWDDTDLDSIEDPDEAGLAGIDVTLEITPPALEASPGVVVTTTTDADGRYSFTAPTGGWYDITITVDPLVVVSSPSSAGGPANNNDVLGRSRDPLLEEPTRAYTRRFLLTAGVSVTDIDIGAVMGGRISGVVFDDLNLDGRRGADEPLSGGLPAYMDVFLVVPEAGIDRAIDYKSLFSTDIYRFAVPPGEVYLDFFNDLTDRSITLPNRGDDDGDNDFSPFTMETARIVVEAGESYELDLGLVPVDGGSVFADIANVDCDDRVSIIDALLIAQYSAGLRTDGVTCPLADPLTQLNVANADINLDGRTDIIDAMLVSQCDAGLSTLFCTNVN